MNITTTTKTVTEHAFILTAEDVERYRSDPWAFRDDMMAQLSGGGNGAVKFKPKRKAATRQSARKNAKTAPRPKGKRRPPERVPCETCGVMIPHYRQGKHKCRTADAAE